MEWLRLKIRYSIQTICQGSTDNLWTRKNVEPFFEVSQEQYYSSRHVETVAEESEHELTSQPEMNSYSDHSEQEAQYQGQVQMNHDGYMSEMVCRILFSNFSVTKIILIWFWSYF